MTTKSGARRWFGEGPPRPRLPCAVTHLGLLSTSTSFYFRKQMNPAPRDGQATALRQSPKPVLRPPLRPRPRAARWVREEGGGGAPPCFLTAQWKGLSASREAGLRAVANLPRPGAASSVRGGRSSRRLVGGHVDEGQESPPPLSTSLNGLEAWSLHLPLLMAGSKDKS